MREPNFKFSMIWLSWWEELVFTEDESIKVTVMPLWVYGNEAENQIEYQWKHYSLSDFVNKFHPNRNQSWAYQWAKFFKYKWKTLLDLRLGKTKKIKKPKLSNSQRKIINTIIETYWLKNNVLIKAIMESIVLNNGIANYTEQIYPYIKTYYPEIYKQYESNEQWFRWLVNATVQRYTKWMDCFWWKEIFISKWMNSWTFYLKGI